MAWSFILIIIHPVIAYQLGKFVEDTLKIK